MALQKDIHLRERYDLYYQFEVFNVTNTPSFDVPTNNITLNPDYRMNWAQTATVIRCSRARAAQ